MQVGLIQILYGIITTYQFTFCQIKKLKKVTICLLTLASLLLGYYSCSKEELTSNYLEEVKSVFINMTNMAKNNYSYYNEESFQKKLSNNEKVLLNSTLSYIESVSNSLTISSLTQYIDKLETITINSEELSNSEREKNLKFLAGINYSIAYWITQNQQ